MLAAEVFHDYEELPQTKTLLKGMLLLFEAAPSFLPGLTENCTLPDLTDQ